MSGIRIIKANLETPEHQQWVFAMVNAYANDPFGNGQGLPEDVQERLIEGLRGHPTTLIFLAMVDQEPVGIAVCFGGFSTFAAKPLINIHDLFVKEEFRGQGFGKELLAAVEKEARETNCCKLTLEVLENNDLARKAYERFGFAQAEYVGGAGGALFYAKSLAK